MTDLSLVKRQPLRVHPSEILRDELKARGWSLQDLAIRIHWNEIATTQLALEMYEAVGEDHSLDCRLGELAGQIATALGVDQRFFINLERQWLESNRAPDRVRATEVNTKDTL